MSLTRKAAAFFVLSLIVFVSFVIFPASAEASFVQESTSNGVFANFDIVEGNLETIVVVWANDVHTPLGDDSRASVDIIQKRNNRTTYFYGTAYGLSPDQLLFDGTNSATLNAVVEICAHNSQGRPVRCSDVTLNLVWTGQGEAISSWNSYTETNGDCTLTHVDLSATRNADVSGSIIKGNQDLAPFTAWSNWINNSTHTDEYSDGCVVIATP